MSPIPDLPMWAAVLVSLLLLVGSAFTLVGSIGLVRLGTFYDRMHAPTIGSSAGVACITTASMLSFSIVQNRVAIQEVLIFVFITITMPVTLMLLARATLFRDRSEGSTSDPSSTEPTANTRVRSQYGPSVDAPKDDSTSAGQGRAD